MGYRVSGILKLPDGAPANNAEIEFISRKNFSPLVQELKSNVKCSATGAYDVTLEYGEYAVIVYPGCTYPAALGTIILAADTVAGHDLPTLLQQEGWQPATPEYIVQIQGWLLESAAHEAASAVSESNAKASELAAKSSELAAEADRSEVASSTAIVVAAQADVTAKAAQVSLDASSALTSKNTAAAAADTASQKAESAATHDASAQDAATRAEQAANVVVGALLDAGQYDASTGVLPAPIMGGTIKRSSIWKVTVGGVAGGISLGVGDSLVYTSSDDSYYKIDNTESVSSVNGETGVVVLTSTKVGADAAGTAAGLLSQHVTKNGAHQISGVSGLADALTGKEQVGVAASLVQQHAAQAGAHPISGVAGLQQELDYKYSPDNRPPSDFLPGEPKMFETRLQLSKRAAEYHPLDGQTVPRSGDAALVAAIMTGEVPSCSDADWLSDPLKRSNYTLGDGATTIRLPDRNGKSVGTVGAVFARGDGTHAPIAGLIHGDATRRVTTSITLHWADEANIIGAVAGAGKGARGNSTKYRSTFGLPVTDGAGSFGEVSLDNSLQVPTAEENRPTSISQVWAVKR